MNMSYDAANLTTPDIKWLGVRPSDLDRFNIPQQCRLPMTGEQGGEGWGGVGWGEEGEGRGGGEGGVGCISGRRRSMDGVAVSAQQETRETRASGQSLFEWLHTHMQRSPVCFVACAWHALTVPPSCRCCPSTTHWDLSRPPSPSAWCVATLLLLLLPAPGVCPHQTRT
jgi:hypothetical protein